MNHLACLLPVALLVVASLWQGRVIRERRKDFMSIRFYDTNLSYHFSWWIGRVGIAIDWWYDMGMRRHWWNPIQIRFHRQG